MKVLYSILLLLIIMPTTFATWVSNDNLIINTILNETKTTSFDIYFNITNKTLYNITLKPDIFDINFSMISNHTPDYDCETIINNINNTNETICEEIPLNYSFNVKKKETGCWDGVVTLEYLENVWYEEPVKNYTVYVRNNTFENLPSKVYLYDQIIFQNLDNETKKIRFFDLYPEITLNTTTDKILLINQLSNISLYIQGKTNIRRINVSSNEYFTKIHNTKNDIDMIISLCSALPQTHLSVSITPTQYYGERNETLSGFAEFCNTGNYTAENIEFNLEWGKDYTEKKFDVEKGRCEYVSYKVNPKNINDYEETNVWHNLSWLIKGENIDTINGSIKFFVEEDESLIDDEGDLLDSQMENFLETFRKICEDNPNSPYCNLESRVIEDEVLVEVVKEVYPEINVSAKTIEELKQEVTKIQNMQRTTVNRIDEIQVPDGTKNGGISESDRKTLQDMVLLVTNFTSSMNGLKDEINYTKQVITNNTAEVKELKNNMTLNNRDTTIGSILLLLMFTALIITGLVKWHNQNNPGAKINSFNFIKGGKNE